MWSCKVAFQQRSINHSAAAPKSFIGELWLKNKGISYQEKGCTSIVSRVTPLHFFPIWSKAILDFGCWCHSELDHSKCFNGTASLARAFYGGLGKWKKKTFQLKRNRWIGGGRRRTCRAVANIGLLMSLPGSLVLREGSRYQIGWSFGKIPNGLWPPSPPSFLENYIANFYNGYGRIYARRHRPDSIS